MSYNKLKIILTMILSEKRGVSHCINYLPNAGGDANLAIGNYLELGA